MSNFVDRELEQIAQIAVVKEAFRNQFTVLSIRSADVVTEMELPDGSMEIQLCWDDFEDLFQGEDYSEMDGPVQGSTVRFLWKSPVMYVADSRF